MILPRAAHAARAGALAIALACAPAAALEPDAEHPPRAEPVLPDLDELLGLDEDERLADELPDPSREDLDRRLSGAEAADRFRRAVTLMDDVAARLERGSDVGITTQRLQEEILQMLDSVIESARQQQRRQEQSSASGSSGQQSSENQPRQSQQQRQGSGESRGSGDTETMPPGGREADPRADRPAAGAAWGALPDRVRDALMQGLSDRYSSVYERMTEEYYRRLAEEGER